MLPAASSAPLLASLFSVVATAGPGVNPCIPPLLPGTLPITPPGNSIYWHSVFSERPVSVCSNSCLPLLLRPLLLPRCHLLQVLRVACASSPPDYKAPQGCFLAMPQGAQLRASLTGGRQRVKALESWLTSTWALLPIMKGADDVLVLPGCGLKTLRSQ